ncbi:MAG: WbuC family cupin fold metalloprotein [SAR324 cluster bacterium]|nr:WbuC family cupin fold metalloprotein [SAR324 cluster bacterium]
MSKVQYINHELLEMVCGQSATSQRRRKNYNFHQPADPAQRMLNALEPDSYVCPHRHSTPPKDEGFLILQGRGAAIVFKDDGKISEIFPLDPSKNLWGVDIPAGRFHTIVALASKTVFYEVKPGPYNPLTDKGFAPWAPPEGHPDAIAYHQELIHLVSESGQI